MPRYLFQLAYTPAAWAAQLRDPQDRVAIVRPVIERLGGRFEGVYFAFGDYDIVAIVEAPDNVSAAAFSLAVSAGGAVKALKTTPLMTIEEGLAAMRKGAEAGALYRPPSGLEEEERRWEDEGGRGR
jgi:uncharacterized protein with GYD domain